MKQINKILEIVGKKNKNKTIGVVLLIFCASIFETVGIASVLPVITIATNPEILKEIDVLKDIEFISQMNNTESLVTITLSFLIIYISAMLVRALSTYSVIKYSMLLEADVSSRYFSAWLSQRFSKLVTLDNREIGKSLLSEVTHVINGAVLSILFLISSASILAMLLGVMLYVDAYVTSLVITIFGGLYFLIFILTKKLLYTIGTERVKANSNRFRIVKDAADLLKQVKISGLECNYSIEYSAEAYKYASEQSKTSIIAQLPKFFLEGIAFSASVLILIYYIESDISDNIATLSLFAIAGYRILPSMQQIYSSLVTLRYSTSAIDKLYNDIFHELKAKHDETSHKEDMQKKGTVDSIVVSNVKYKYIETEPYAINNISIELLTGNIYSFIGRSGSGKSTIIDLLTGLLVPDKGYILINGKKDLLFMNYKVGYCTQKTHLIKGTILDNICLGDNQKRVNEELLSEAIEVTGLKEIRKNLDEMLNLDVGEGGENLSGGQAQRIGVAREIYKNPDILILDESTSALDNNSEKLIMENIKRYSKEKNIICVQSSHREQPLRYSDHIFIMDNGEVVDEGSLDHLQKNNENYINIFKKHQ